MVEKELEELRKAEQEEAEKKSNDSIVPEQSEASTTVVPQPIEG
jgi:hypothetical protein